MSTCTNWVTKRVITCKNWATQVDYECTTWADEGSYQCSQWADEGSKQCTSWEKCHWYTPWNCIAGFFCRAWYWVAKWVCKAWYWVAKWVCKAFAWVAKAVCVVWSWAATLVCVAWDTLKCALLALLRSLSSLSGERRRARRRVEHVFVLMLENRSFDHVFGFSEIAGVGVDGNPTTVDGADPTRDANPFGGVDVPVAAPADFALKDVDKDPGHEFDDALAQLCGPDVTYQGGPYPQPITNSGFVQNYADTGSPTPERIMKCYAPEQLPVLHALAREFAICDRWFSSLPGPTFPNRFFALAGTSGGLDGSPSKLDIVAATTVDGYRFANGNVFDLLDRYCIEWRIFEGDEFPVSFVLSGMTLNALQGRFDDFDELASELSAPSLGPRFVFIEPQYGAHDFAVTGPGDFTCGNSMHPLDDVTRGERLVKDVYEAIRNSPHWERTLLIVAFDEHGGFYDHVAPAPAVPPGDPVPDAYVQNHFEFDQLGVRVPALVVSPYIRKGVVDHRVRPRVDPGHGAAVVRPPEPDRPRPGGERPPASALARIAANRRADLVARARAQPGRARLRGRGRRRAPRQASGASNRAENRTLRRPAHRGVPADVDADRVRAGGASQGPPDLRLPRARGVDRPVQGHRHGRRRGALHDRGQAEGRARDRSQTVRPR